MLRNELAGYEGWLRRQRKRYWAFKRKISKPSVQGYMDNIWHCDVINIKIDIKEIFKNSEDVINLWNEVINY